MCQLFFRRLQTVQAVVTLFSLSTRDLFYLPVFVSAYGKHWLAVMAVL